MHLKFNCTKCGQEIVIKYLKVGEITKCRNCGYEVAVPENATVTDETPTIEKDINTFSSASEQKSEVTQEIKKPGFFASQFSLKSTDEQIIFDATAGIIAPVICLIADPIVFTDRTFDGGFLSEYAFLAYMFVLLQIIVLAVILINNHRKPIIDLLLAGSLLCGAIFSSLLGFAMLPYTLFALIFIIGILGFTPFITSFVFLRNGIRSIRTGLMYYKQIVVILTVFISFSISIVFPIFTDIQFNNKVKQIVKAILDDNETNRVSAQAKLKTINKLFKVSKFVDNAIKNGNYYQIILEGDDNQREMVEKKLKPLAEFTVFPLLRDMFFRTYDAKKIENIRKSYKNITGRELYVD